MNDYIEDSSGNLIIDLRLSYSAEKEKGEAILKPLRLARRFLFVFIVVLVVGSPFLIFSAQAAEPSLETILNNLGFTNRALSNVQTFSAGTYNFTLYAEFAGWHAENELSYYQVGTSVYNVIFTGPEGNSGYVTPPITKTFAINYQFGISFLSPGPRRYFTEYSKNGDGVDHCKIYENLDAPGMFLIGFENTWGGGDKDFNDMVFALKPCPNQAPVASFTYSPANPLIYDIVTFNASASYDPDGSIVSYTWDFGDGNVTTVTNPIITHVYTTALSTVNYTVTLTVTDNKGATGLTTRIVPVTNPSILYVSLPAGTYVGPDPDNWLSQCWLLNNTGLSGSFTVRINNTACGGVTSYDTHLIIALNNASYQYLDSLTVNTTTIPKTSFIYGTPEPYGFNITWEEDVYPTWFSDAYVVGNISSNSYKDVTVLVSFSNTTGVRMHFDAYGSSDYPPPPPPPASKHVTHNPHQKDSTVLFWPPPVVQYYLTVKTDPPGVTFISGEGWYTQGTNVTLTAPTPVSVSTGIQYRFSYWDVDGTPKSGNPITVTMDANHTATAHYVLQYYLTVSSPYGTTGGQGWYDNSTTAYATVTPLTVAGSPGVQYVFTNWSGDATGTTSPSNPITMNAPKTATANWKTQYYLTLATNPPSINAPSGEGWYDAGTNASISTAQYVDITLGVSRYRFINWTTADMSEITNALSPSTNARIDKAKTVTANYVIQYNVTFAQTGLDATATGTVVTINGVGKTYNQLPNSTWFDNGSLVTYLYSNVSSTVSGKRFNLTSIAGPASSITVSGTVTVTGNYKIQFEVTFNQSGIGTDFTGTVVTINGTEYGVSDLPKSLWWDENSQHNFSFASPLVVNASKQYVWFSTSGLSTLQNDTLTITGSGSVVGNYSTGVKYQITFNQTGVNSDYNGTIVTIDDTPYNRTALPVSFWWDFNSNHTFAFQSQLVVTPNAKRYVWNSTSGLSSLQSGSINVSMSGNVIGNYKTQYYLTVISPYDTLGGEGWYYESTTAYATLTTNIVDHGNGTRRVFTQWSGDASGTGLTSNSITMDGPKTAVAIWKTQYLVSFAQTGSAVAPTVTYTADTDPTGTVPFSVWVKAGSQITYGYQSVVLGTTGVRYVLVSTSPASPQTVNGPLTITGTYKVQYYLTVTTDPSGLIPAPTPLSDWHDEFQDVQLTAPDPSYKGATQYQFNYWDVDGLPKVTGVKQITVPMTGPHTATAHYQTAAPPPSAVGGFALPITLDLNTSNSLIPQIGLASTLSATAAATVILVRRRKKTLKREH